jgi:HD-like signal output (HDOD) protein
MTISLESLVRGTTEVASLPDLFVRLDEAINAPNSSFAMIGKIISDDTGLTARLLRISNSALYGFPSKVETVQRAMAIIGTKQIRELALATTVLRMFKGLKNPFVTMESFWQHSVACGVAARIIATTRRENNVERFFVLGLLHDVGRVIMFMKAPDQSNKAFQLAQSSQQLLFQAEQEVFGYHHGDVGRALLDMWKLPKVQQEAVGCHHNPARAVHYPLETAVVHAADIIANALQLGSSGERCVPILNTAAWARLDIPDNQLPAMIKHIEQQYFEAIKLFLDDIG